MKEDRLDRGKGIHLFRDTEPIPRCESLHGDGVREPALVQRYISRPCLLDGRKFHLRTIVLVSARRGVWMHDNVYVYRCGTEYDANDLSNRAAHLSNLHIAQHAILEHEEIGGTSCHLSPPSPSLHQEMGVPLTREVDDVAQHGPTIPSLPLPPPPPPPPPPTRATSADAGVHGVSQFVPGAPIPLSSVAELSNCEAAVRARMKEIVRITTTQCPGAVFDGSMNYVVLAYDWMLEEQQQEEAEAEADQLEEASVEGGGREGGAATRPPPNVILLEVNGTPGNLIGKRRDQQDMVDEIGHLMIDVRLRGRERTMHGFESLEPETHAPPPS